MKLSKQEIVSLYVGLNNVGDLPGFKFAYAVNRNLAKIKPVIDELQASKFPSKEYIAFDKERADLAKKFAVISDGKEVTKVENGQEVYVMADEAGFNTELENLKKVHQAAVDGREKQIKDFEESLKEEIEVDLYLIPADYVPEGITGNQLKNIACIIKDN